MTLMSNCFLVLFVSDSAKMPSPSTSQASSESAEANNQQSSIKVEEDGNSPSQYATFGGFLYS